VAHGAAHGIVSKTKETLCQDALVKIGDIARACVCVQWVCDSSSGVAWGGPGNFGGAHPLLTLLPVACVHTDTSSSGPPIHSATHPTLSARPPPTPVH
jgi:hypothetical protein